MLVKNCKHKKKVLSIILIAIVLVIIYRTYHDNRNRIPKIASYYGSNYSYSVTFTRYLDFDSFLNAKPDDIWIYDSADDVSDLSGFIVGEIRINDTDDKEGNLIDLFTSCNIELIRKSKWNTSSTTMNFEDPKDGITRMSFTAYDFDDSEGNIYNTAILKIGEKEIPIELKIKK